MGKVKETTEVLRDVSDALLILAGFISIKSDLISQISDFTELLPTHHRSLRREKTQIKAQPMKNE